eukprot:TRINITY_DN7713_c0_g1_i1.p1 TRINITY_DN7713_c0_g1~~TRINITY_DN7713_c0_g1_i1.p1  ORF type:complete len:657 (+),score=110.96 TRINITY_DN7713_c0_g1_i1:82-2052(+)
MSELFPGGDSVRRAVLRKKEYKGRCSWCFSPEPIRHQSEERYLLRKDLHHCTNCLSKTVRCTSRGCQDFARGYEGLLLHDSHCYQHLNIINNWEGKKTREELAITRFCSWCFVQSSHTLIHFQKKLYECNKCYRVGKQCRTCDDALSRHSSRNKALGGEKCLLCAGTITSWSEQEKAFLQITGWCSICLEYCSHSLLADHRVQRNEYLCSVCSTITCRCAEHQMNGCHNFVRNAMKSLRCRQCKDPLFDWKLVQSRKTSFLNAFTPETIKADLARDSQQKFEATQKGMLRPFLHLVSMHPAARNSLALSLGMNLLVSYCFGDSHVESWYIIRHKTKGLLFRGSERFESICRKETSWYNILRRVEAANLKGRDVGSKLGDKDAYVNSLTKGLELELDFMEKLASQQRAKISSEKSARAKTLLDSPTYREISEKMSKNGISRDSLQHWIVESFIDVLEDSGSDSEDMSKSMNELVLYQIIQGQSYFQVKKRQEQIAAKCAQIGLTIAIQQMIIIPLVPALGVAYIMYRIGDAISEAVWGSEPEILFAPIQQILMQRLFLAYAGITIDDYYTTQKSSAKEIPNSPYSPSIITASSELVQSDSGPMLSSPTLSKRARSRNEKAQSRFKQIPSFNGDSSSDDDGDESESHCMEVTYNSPTQ